MTAPSTAALIADLRTQAEVAIDADLAYYSFPWSIDASFYRDVVWAADRLAAFATVAGTILALWDEYVVPPAGWDDVIDGLRELVEGT